MKGLCMGITAVNNRYNIATRELPNNQNNTETVDTTSYPAIYTEETPEKSSASSLALIGLGLLAAGGIGYGIYKHRSVSSITKELAEQKTALEKATKDLKAANDKVSISEKAVDAANKQIESLKESLKEATDKAKDKAKNIKDKAKDTGKKVSEKAKPFKEKWNNFWSNVKTKFSNLFKKTKKETPKTP